MIDPSGRFFTRFHAIYFLLSWTLALDCSSGFDSSAALAAEQELSGKITVLYASSLAGYFTQAKQQFERKHSNLKVQLEPGASLVLIRKVTDLQQEADVLVIADRALVPAFKMTDYLAEPIDFLTEQMALVIAQDAKYGKVVNAENWPEILLKPEVVFGISDPSVAPVGYRTLMVWKLAENFYKRPKLYETLFQKASKRHLRQNAAALLTLVKTGEVDYAFNYFSLAAQNGLGVVKLPPEINMGNPKYTDLYRSVTVKVQGEKPGTKQTLRGEPLVYTIGVLKNAPNAAAAREFFRFVVGKEGKELATRLGMSPLEAR